MTQLAFNYNTRPDPSVQRSRRSDESADAWATAKRSAGKRVLEIYRLIELFGPMTTKELAAELGATSNEISGRVSEMCFTKAEGGYGLLYKMPDPDKPGKFKRRNGGALRAIARPWDGKAESL